MSSERVIPTVRMWAVNALHEVKFVSMDHVLAIGDEGRETFYVAPSVLGDTYGGMVTVGVTIFHTEREALLKARLEIIKHQEAIRKEGERLHVLFQKNMARAKELESVEPIGKREERQ